MPTALGAKIHRMAKGIAHRDWSISRDSFRTEDEFRDAVRQELASAEHIGQRLGVALTAAPIRYRDADGVWITRGWIFKTGSVPGIPGPEEPMQGDAPTIEVPEPDAVDAPAEP